MFGFLCIYVVDMGPHKGQVRHAVYSEPDAAANKAGWHAVATAYDVGQVWTSEGVACAVAHFKQTRKL